MKLNASAPVTPAGTVSATPALNLFRRPQAHTQPVSSSHPSFPLLARVFDKIFLRGLVPCAHWAIFKRLSLGGYGDLACIKSI